MEISSARHDFARTNADVDSLSQQIIPVVDGRVLVRLAAGLEDDCNIVQKPLEVVVAVLQMFSVP